MLVPWRIVIIVIYLHLVAPDSASRLVSFDADSYSHNVEVRSGDAESGASLGHLSLGTYLALGTCHCASAISISIVVVVVIVIVVIVVVVIVATVSTSHRHFHRAILLLLLLLLHFLGNYIYPHHSHSSSSEKSGHQEFHETHPQVAFTQFFVRSHQENKREK